MPETFNSQSYLDIARLPQPSVGEHDAKSRVWAVTARRAATAALGGPVELVKVIVHIPEDGPANYEIVSFWALAAGRAAIERFASRCRSAAEET